MYNISELTEVEPYYWNYWYWLNVSKIGYLLDSEDCYSYYTVSSNKGKVAILSEDTEQKFRGGGECKYNFYYRLNLGERIKNSKEIDKIDKIYIYKDFHYTILVTGHDDSNLVFYFRSKKEAFDLLNKLTEIEELVELSNTVTQIVNGDVKLENTMVIYDETN